MKDLDLHWMGAVFVAYGLGVLNERWWPGERAVPASGGEALLWLAVMFLMVGPPLWLQRNRAEGAP